MKKFANNFRDRKSNAIFGRWKAKFCRKFPRWRPQFANFVNWSANTTRRPASTGIFFAGTQRFRSIFAHSQKRDYCLKSSLRKFSTNVNSTTDFYVLCKRGGITTFRSKFFVSQYRKISGNTSVYQKILGSEKFYASERGGVWSFFVENFCHTVPKNFVREHFGVSENFVHRKILCIRRGYH